MKIIEYSPTKKFALNEFDEIVDMSKMGKPIIRVDGNFEYLYTLRNSILSNNNINTQEDILWFKSKILTDRFYKIVWWRDKLDIDHFYLASDKYVPLSNSKSKDV